MSEFSLITLERIVDRCLSKFAGQRELLASLISDNSYMESWNAFLKWAKYELDLGRGIKIPGLGIMSSQTFRDEQVIYFRLEDNFLKTCNLFYEDIDIKECKYPVVSINYSNIKKLTSVDKKTMSRAIENIFSEIAQIFQEFYSGSFQLDLGILGKFFLSDRSLRFLPYTKPKKVTAEKKVTVKNLIEMNMRRYPQEQMGHVESRMSQSKSQIKEDLAKVNQDIKINAADHQRSIAKSIFSQHSDFVSPIRRTVVPNYSEEKDLNLLFGAGTDPLALNQNFSMMAANSSGLIGAVFAKPPFARIRCPPVIDLYSRTLASPVASQYNSLSTSSRIGLFYSPATKFLYLDSEKNEVAYLKIKENKTKLTANEELLKPLALEEEEISQLVAPKANKELEERIEAKRACFKRYREYIEHQIPEDIIAPIRQYWITNVLDLISGDQKELDDGTVVRIVDGLLSEINNGYKLAVKKSILDYILLDDSEKLRIGILQRFDAPVDFGQAKPRGILATQGWVDRVQVSRGELKRNVVNYNHATLSIIAVWAEISKDPLFILPRQDDPRESFAVFNTKQTSSISAIGSKVKGTWHREVSKIYFKELSSLTKGEIAKFFTATKMLMSSQLREFIYKSLKDLKSFISNYEQEVYLTPQQCIQNDRDRSQMLQKSFLVLKIVGNVSNSSNTSDTKIRFQEKTESIRKDILDLIDLAVEISDNVPLPQNSMARLSDTTLCKINGKEDEVVNEIRRYIDKVVSDNVSNLDKVLEIFADYEKILTDTEPLTAQLKAKPPLKEYEKLVLKYRTLESQIEKDIPFEIYMNMALIDCRSIRSVLLDKCKKNIELILKSVETNMISLNSFIMEENSKMFEIFEQTGKGNTTSKGPDANHYAECEAKRDQIKTKERPKMFACLKELSENLFFLYKYGLVVSEEKLAPLKVTAGTVHEIDDKINKYTNQLIEMRETIKKELEHRKTIFDETLRKLKEKLEEVKKYEEVDLEGDTASAGIQVMNELLHDCEEEAKKIQDNQGKIGARKTTFEDLEKVSNTIQPYNELWKVAQIARENITKWEKTEAIFRLDAAEVAKATKMMMNTATSVINRLEEMDPKPDTAIETAKAVQMDIKKFSDKTPMLTALCAKGMEQRHWDELNEHLVKKNVDMRWSSDSDYRLYQCDEAGLNSHIDVLKTISEKAEKEYKNLKLLQQMYADWDGIEIKLKSWKETQYYVIVGDSVDEIQTLLDDHIIQTQTMKGSQFAKIFDAEIQKWEGDLLYVRDTLEVWLKVQANWIYLSPIFASPDIKKELPHEDSEFTRVNNKWKEIMSHTLTSNKAIQLPRDQTLKEQLKQMLEKLENIQEKLVGYLNMKRSMFPRFYFLSSDALIEVLSEAQDATKIQKYCKTLFEGIKSLQFDSDDVILGMKSSEDEYVPFEQMIATKTYRGMVEQWLQLLENQMVDEVRRFIELSHLAFSTMSREEFVLDRPGQAVLNVDMTQWTKDCETAIKAGREGLPIFYKRLDQELLKIVQLVKKNITPLNRCTLEALIVLDVHNQEVVKQLIEAKVQHVTDFDYEAQLRYYWDLKPESKQYDTIVKMINTTLDYNYEYLGNSSRLVITPLTDRCYRTLCGAIGLNYGGAPEGPAGTGKTETVKDLAKALARMIIVFNCSDSISYTGMARFFKGLCCTGGWSCLDEFNRIQLEVLSVIAQQLQCIQNAIKEGKTSFEFSGTLIKLKPTCNCFITMNPGYAGRSELPDNLKALFRSVAMMVPDYALIGQIRLYSFGFSQAQPLSKKIVTTYRLCSEQISYQKHYDYGMRAVNSVLVAAGNLRKANPNEQEDIQVLRAINEVNEAKFLSVDLPLFKDITKDLFPETVLPEIDIKKLLECILEVIHSKDLEPLPYFIDKIIQIYQMVLVRHGLMVVGEPFGGKTTALQVLAESLGLMNEKFKEEKVVECIVINPKSITSFQLYGFTDIATNEWTDGVLPVKFKKMANDEPTERKWLIFDGPVDAVWIEDMNTVLDDNKKLCLSNGDIFYMSNTMNLIFEPMDLLVASPATVSRCGMILMEPHMMGWIHLYTSWKKTLSKALQDYELEEMDVYFINVFTPLVKIYEKGTFEVTAPTKIQTIVSTLLKIAKPFIDKFDQKEFYNGMEPKERRAYFDKVFTYATIWSLGATLTVEHRLKFDSTIKKLVNTPDSSLSQEQAKKHRKVELPDGGSGRVFEHYLLVEDPMQLDDGTYKVITRWPKWAEALDSSVDLMKLDERVQANEIIVDTVDLIRYSKLIEQYINNLNHVLVCGPTGTGKTIYIKRIMKKLDKAHFQTLEIGFSAQTTANQVQEIIDSQLIRRSSKGIYGPPPNKRIVVFVDDLSMPKKEEYGAQPPIELLRQLLGKHGWYDHTEKHKPFKTIQDVVFLSAMSPPGAGRNDITPRFQRLLNLISFTSIDDSQMELIFRTILNWHFQSKNFESEVSKLCIPLVKATSQVYAQVMDKFKPLPSKSHYLFNLRDFAKVIFGLCMSDKDRYKSKDLIIKLWVHEVWRVFGDRLNTEEDRLILLKDILKKLTQKMLNEQFDNLFATIADEKTKTVETLEQMRKVIFTDVTSSTSLKYRPYEMITDTDKLLRACENALKQYDAMSDKPLNIVLFNFAIEHLLIISRILKQPGGNALLVGVGGSGRTSLTKLAAKIADYNLFQIELSKTYGVPEWKDDLKQTLKAAGGKAENTVFLFRDSQVKYESFIEDINNLLNNGEVPNLFPPEERGEILELSRKNAKALDLVDVETTEQLLTLFTETVKKKLHVVLCFSPIGNNFKNKIRMFPSLVNCCTIDWYFEWPVDALVSVAQRFIGEVALPESVKAQCVEMVEFFHTDTQEWAANFLKALKRHYYVTPTSYIEMIQQFKTLLEEKTSEVSSQQFKYANGYNMIIEADESVDLIKKELKDLAPKLEASKINVEAIVAETTIKKQEAEEVQKVVSEEKASCEVIAGKAKEISDECKAELNEVIPGIMATLEKLAGISPAMFVDLQGARIPMPLLLTSQCLAIILGQPEEKEMNPETMRQETNWRKTTQKMYFNIPKLISDMKFFNEIEDKDNFDKDIRVIDDKTFKRIDTLFKENPDQLIFSKVKNSSSVCGEIFSWVEAQLKLQPIEISARPKRQKYLVAKKEYEDAMDKLAKKQEELDQKEKELSEYTKRLELKKDELQKLENEFKYCKLKLSRSEILINNLRDEKGRWKDLSEVLKEELANLVGDVLVSSAVIAYLGPFTSLYRSNILAKWAKKSREVKVPGSETPSLVKTFGDPVKIRSWQIKGLPSDNFSTENAIILTKSRRFSLCIDPQIQANKWIKAVEKDKLKITTLASNFMKDIELAIRNGLPCLLENVGEEIDPSLDPILLKLITGTGAMATIKLGDKVVDYNENFFFYITTKERNPHYLPEVSTKVTLINFMITSEGLSDQLLAIIVKEEMPEKEKIKNELIERSARNKEELRDLENQILQTLALPKSSLLESDEAIDILTKSKSKSNDIIEEQKISDETEAEINKARSNYVEISQTASCLFFAISDLGYIDPMYQYSLTYFIDLFIASIQKSEKNNDLPQRLKNIEDHFLYSLYLNISRSLFVKDKLLFSFLLSVRIKQYRKEIEESYYNFFLTGSVGKPANWISIPSRFNWITKSIWENFCRLSEFKGRFDNIHTNFESMADDWNRIYNSEDPLKEPFPPIFEKSLTFFEKMIVMKLIRPDKMVPFIQHYVIESLGQKFVEIPAFDIEAVYAESSKTTPLIFVLTPGVDPYNMLKQFADKKGIILEGISLGQGQGEIALKKINEATDRGSWVVLQNCHLAQSFMNPLEKKCDEIGMAPGRIHENFRLWLTSYPSNDFPASILQDGIKMTNEPPSGLKNNLKTALMLDEIADPNHFNKSSNLNAYRRLVFGLCFFHSVIQERRKFGPLGWNIPYEFTESDLRISAAQLRIFIDKYPDELPLQALKYLTAECNYGGRVTDDKDRRLLKVLLEDYYNKDLATIPNYELLPGSHRYIVPSFHSYQDYLHFVDKLDLNTPPGIYGFHVNANITKELNETAQLMAALLTCQGTGGSSSGDDSDAFVNFLNKILEDFPKPFNENEARMKYLPPDIKNTDSMNIILLQEVSRFNKLIKVIRGSLTNIIDALFGRIVFSFELEEALNFIKVNKVPKVWMDNSYPSLKPLPAYIDNLKQRIHFFGKWVEEGKPPVFWIGGFFFPQGFLTGVQQNFARKYTIAIDHLVYDFEVMPEDYDKTQAPEDGALVEGFFLEGARFDYERMTLGESDPKILFVPGPCMYFKPIDQKDLAAKPKKTNSYECPLYRTGDRRGVLMTTGHSTNFVMLIKLPTDDDERHWIKRGVAAITQLND